MRSNKNNSSRLIFGAIFVVGCGFLLIAAWPFIRSSANQFWQSQNQPLFPLVADEFFHKMDQSPKILGDFTQLPEEKAPLILDTALDYSNLENWFSSAPLIEHQQTQQSYTLEIPKLGIYNALVKVGGTNIDNNLVQFNSEVQVGDYGAPVIFGHSTLRQLYNPKESNKNRYKSIFSTIMTLGKGDLIYITQDEIIYTFRVIEKKEVAADDDYILAQNTNAPQLKLVTCTPEGTFLRRGVITAELVL